MTDHKTCETCGAPVTQNIHGEVWNTHDDLLKAAVAAAYEDCWEQGKQVGRFAPDVPEDALAALEQVKLDAYERGARDAFNHVGWLRAVNDDPVAKKLAALINKEPGT